MASRVGDSDAVDWLARACDDEGRVLVQIGRRGLAEIEGRIDNGSFVGPAADRTQAKLLGGVEELNAVERELAQAAEALRAHAAWIRERERHLQNLERRIRAWIHLHRRNVIDAVLDEFNGLAGIAKPYGSLDDHDVHQWCRSHVAERSHDGLPVPYADSWDDLADYLRRHGAHLPL